MYRVSFILTIKKFENSQISRSQQFCFWGKKRKPPKEFAERKRERIVELRFDSIFALIWYCSKLESMYKRTIVTERLAFVNNSERDVTVVIEIPVCEKLGTGASSATSRSHCRERFRDAFSRKRSVTKSPSTAKHAKHLVDCYFHARNFHFSMHETFIKFSRRFCLEERWKKIYIFLRLKMWKSTLANYKRNFYRRKLKVTKSSSSTGSSKVHVQLRCARPPHGRREDPARGPRRRRGPRILQRQRARRKREDRRVHRWRSQRLQRGGEESRAGGPPETDPHREVRLAGVLQQLRRIWKAPLLIVRIRRGYSRDEYSNPRVTVRTEIGQLRGTVYSRNWHREKEWYIYRFCARGCYVSRGKGIVPSVEWE